MSIGFVVGFQIFYDNIGMQSNPPLKLIFSITSINIFVVWKSKITLIVVLRNLIKMEFGIVLRIIIWKL